MKDNNCLDSMSRRRHMKSIAVGSAVVGKWAAPVVAMSNIPAHAQSSGECVDLENLHFHLEVGDIPQPHYHHLSPSVTLKDVTLLYKKVDLPILTFTVAVSGNTIIFGDESGNQNDDEYLYEISYEDGGCMLKTFELRVTMLF